MSTHSVATMEKIVSLCKRRGYIFPGSEIYGGLANTWDYGPLGVEFKNNVKQAWWRDFVRAREDIVGMDSGILMNPRVWEASGHVSSFADPLMDCRRCKERVRGDKVLEERLGVSAVVGKTFGEIHALFDEHGIACPNCGAKDWTPPRAFNLMFKTHQGVIEETANVVYLRPETAQGIFVNFRNVYTSMRMRTPFGIAQIGKSFRNEITPGNFTFRTREFEQMEMEFFCKPGTELEWFAYWKEFCWNWLMALGIRADRLRMRDHDAKELSHYSNATTDIEYAYPFGWGELWGIASRTDYDLRRHMEFSGEDLQYIDQPNNEKYIPSVVEPALGADRLALTLLIDAYDEAEVQGEKRVFLRLHPRLAPIKAAVLPLSKKEPLIELSRRLYRELLGSGAIDFDVTGSIGKRYARQDEVGTPYCITVDFESLEDRQVTIRERDSMKQDRIAVDQVRQYLADRLDGR